MLYVCASSHFYVFYADKTMKMPENALMLRGISNPLASVFFSNRFIQDTGPGWRVGRDLWHHFFISSLYQIFLVDAMEFAYGRSFWYLPALSEKVMASGSAHLSPSGSKSMYSDSKSGNDGRYIYNGNGSSSNAQLGNL